MQAGLTKLRKQLTVETGPSPAELAAQKAESASAGGSATNTLLEEAAGENEVVQVSHDCSYCVVLCYCAATEG